VNDLSKQTSHRGRRPARALKHQLKSDICLSLGRRGRHIRSPGSVTCLALFGKCGYVPLGRFLERLHCLLVLEKSGEIALVLGSGCSGKSGRYLPRTVRLRLQHGRQLLRLHNRDATPSSTRVTSPKFGGNTPSGTAFGPVLSGLL